MRSNVDAGVHTPGQVDRHLDPEYKKKSELATPPITSASWYEEEPLPFHIQRRKTKREEKEIAINDLIFYFCSISSNFVAHDWRGMRCKISD